MNISKNTYGSLDYRFNGKELDPETGNYYYGARYYNPKISLWLSVDPLAGDFPHLTPYNFTENNPVMLIDPDGMASYWPGVTFTYNESNVGIAFTKFGAQYIQQRGVARDEIGKTHYIMQSTPSISPESDGDFLIGGSAKTSFGVKQSWKAETFLGVISEENMTVSLGVTPGVGFDAGVGDEEVSFALSFGLDGSIESGVMEVQQSISLTDSQADQVNGMNDGIKDYWGLENVSESRNENGYFTANVTVGTDSGTSTNQTVISKDRRIWYSQEYLNQANDLDRIYLPNQ